jgi:hypothetical protein
MMSNMAVSLYFISSGANLGAFVYFTTVTVKK